MAKAKKKAPRKPSKKAAKASKSAAKKVVTKAVKKASSRRKSAAAQRRLKPLARPVLRSEAQAKVVHLARPPMMPASESYKDKLDALGRVQDALRAQLGNSPAEDVRINANIDSLAGEQRVVEAQIAAAEDGSLAPPAEADVSVLQDAIRAADDVIAQNAAVNQLIKAAAALIGTLHN